MGREGTSPVPWVSPDEVMGTLAGLDNTLGLWTQRLGSTNELADDVLASGLLSVVVLAVVVSCSLGEEVLA